MAFGQADGLARGRELHQFVIASSPSLHIYTHLPLSIRDVPSSEKQGFLLSSTFVLCSVAAAVGVNGLRTLGWG